MIYVRYRMTKAYNFFIAIFIAFNCAFKCTVKKQFTRFFRGFSDVFGFSKNRLILSPYENNSNLNGIIMFNIS
jgi:hypothetical protein